MLEISELRLPLTHTGEGLRVAVVRHLGVSDADVTKISIYRRAIDARKKEDVCYRYTVQVKVADEKSVLERTERQRKKVKIAPDRTYRMLEGVTPPSAVADCDRPIIVGSGPCGLFASLLLARHGLKPRLFERGKAAGDRARDVTGFWRRGLPFQPESNVQFGEGGAGTFSDGKLYTQIKDRDHRITWLLKEMVAAGAPEDILLKAKPHIGTDRLIKVVRHIREEIIALGGEVHFESRIDDVLLGDDGAVRGVRLSNGDEVLSKRVVMAVGHSARDVFTMLHERGVAIEQKPISIGVRVEHPQAMIDRTQYGKFAKNGKLGSAPYKFVNHDRRGGRSSYSFCMCPGGLVVAAASEEGQVVTNGMSSYARAEANANSGFMVEVQPSDYGSDDPLAGIAYQRKWERAAFVAGGENYNAPVQLMRDFLKGKPTTDLGSVKPSYEPGVTPGDLSTCLPDYVIKTLRKAIPHIDKRLSGFAHPEALLIGVETRSSSPLRVTRDPISLESISTPGLYPAGEGAGYAGGIISAAVDGMRVAEVLLRLGES